MHCNNRNFNTWKDLKESNKPNDGIKTGKSFQSQVAIILNDQSAETVSGTSWKKKRDNFFLVSGVLTDKSGWGLTNIAQHNCQSISKLTQIL